MEEVKKGRAQTIVAPQQQQMSVEPQKSQDFKVTGDPIKFSEYDRNSNYVQSALPPDQQQLFDKLLSQDNQRAVSYLMKKRTNIRTGTQKMEEENIARMSRDVNKDYFDEMFSGAPKHELTDFQDYRDSSMNPSFIEEIKGFTQLNESKIEEPIKSKFVQQSQDIMDKIEKQMESSVESDEDDEDEKVDQVGELDIAMQSPKSQNEYLGDIMNEEFEEREISSGSPASGKKKSDYKKDGESGEDDKIRLVEKNERRHEEVAKVQLEKDQIISLKATKSDETHRYIISKPLELNKVSSKIQREHKFNGSTVTAIAVSDDLLFYGTSDGVLRMFDRESEEEYDTFIPSKKELQKNAVTCLDVHPLKSEYVIIGYTKGQLILLDSTDPKKPIKTISDYHKGTQIINVKFCDWRSRPQYESYEDSYEESVHQSQIISETKEKQQWMFVSIDENGKVVLSTVSKVLIVMKSSKQVLYQPKQGGSSKYTSVSCRFFSSIYPQGDMNDQACILALGNAQEVNILSVTPKNYEILMRASKPKSYFNKKLDNFVDIKPNAPILCWGYGHTPIFKDKAYSILAIGWGPLIQLVILNHLEDEQNPFLYDGFYLIKPEQTFTQAIYKELKEETKGECEDEEIDDAFNEDFEQSFSNSSLNIEGMSFLSNSTLMVLTRGNTIRIMNTEIFRPEEFYSDMHRRLKLYKKGIKIDDSDHRVAELGDEMKIDPIKPSQFGVKYLQTFKFFNGMGFILNEFAIQKFFHVSWSQSLREYKKEVEGNWVNMFNRALSFYRGNLKGYSGIYDDEEMRESVMKAELKLLIIEFIQEELQKQNTLMDQFEMNSNKLFGTTEKTKAESSDQNIKDSILKLAECRKERDENYKTLLRIVIEFCVELEDSHFLFYDLFLFFRDEQLEDLFIEQLEPFIMAGKFSSWEIANENLQNHLINYYKESAKPENLEKIIINLNFSDFDKNIILELINYCEQHYLSTAVLYLYTHVIEGSDVQYHPLILQDVSCTKVLNSIVDLYHKANYTGTIEEIEDLSLLSLIAPQRFEIEKSQIYLGYKLLWIIKLFLSGQKFPKGSIKDMKWRIYVSEVVQFVSVKENLKMLLKIDSEAFFQIISIVFYQGKQFDFVKEGSSNNQKNVTHKYLLELLRQTSKETKNDEVELSHLFFEANIAVTSDIEQEAGFYYQVVKDLLQEDQKFLMFNEHSLKRTMSRTRMMRKMSRTMVRKIPDEVKYQIKSENDLIDLVKKSEPLSDEQLEDLIILSKNTKFMLLRVYLLEKKGLYVMCLQILLEGIRDKDDRYQKYLQEIAFNWMREKILFLEKKSKESEKSEKTYKLFKKELLDNIKYMVLFNVQESIHLIDQYFGAIHFEIVDQLKRYPNEQLLYLENFLSIKDEHIQKVIKEYIISQNNAVEAKKYLEMLKLNLKLCCQYKKESVIEVVEKICLQSFDPTDECLQICQEYKQDEACALLNKKLGKYFDSVQMYLKVIHDKVDFKQLKREFKIAQRNNLSTEYCIKHQNLLPHCTIFDHYFKTVVKICKKNHDDVDIGKEEQIWFIILDMLFAVKAKPGCGNNQHYQQFFNSRIQYFSKILMKYIKFKNFLNHVLIMNKNIKYKDLLYLIHEILNDSKYYTIILNNSMHAIKKTNTMLFQQFQQGSSEGVLFRSLKCQHCQRYLEVQDIEEDNRKSLEIKNFDMIEELPNDLYYDVMNNDIRIFDCRHTFHFTCLQKICYLKTDEPEQARDDRMKKLRCPKCFSQNMDIDGDSGSPVRPKLRSKALNSKSSNDQLKENTEETLLQRELERRQSALNYQIMKFNKKMNYFESDLDSEFLSYKSFK